MADIHSRTFFVKETLMRMFTPLFMAVLLGCGTNGPQAPRATSEDVRHEESAPHNPVLFPKQSRPYGQSIERWSELLWSYIYSIPVDQNPFFDTTGANCAVEQNGPVWFLPATPGSSLGTNVSRSCTIPHDRAIMMQLSSALNDFPCPDPNFHPAPGQSLYDFLIGGISPLFDGETGFVVSLDGVNIEDPLSYRFFSHDVFQFEPDLSMQAFDPCITQTNMQGVTDGFYLLFKPMTPGEHTLVINGHDMQGIRVTITEHLTIQ